MKTVKLITIDNLTEAHLIKGRLNNEGIECFLTNENFTNLMPHFNNMMDSGIQVFVLDYDLEKAREIIQDKINPTKENIICPNCGSSDIKLGIGKNKGIKIFNILLAIFSGIPLGNLKPKYYCRTCKVEIK